MSTGTGDADVALAIAEARQPSLIAVDEKLGVHRVSEHSSDDAEPQDAAPSDDEMQTLRRVSGRIPWLSFTVAFVELAERFSYYGTTVIMQNYIQQPRPYGSPTGAIALSPGADIDNGVSGGLGFGQRAATGLTTFNNFWSYVMPLLGGYIADTYLGRFATIQYSILFALVGHVVLVISALPPVLDHPNSAIGVFSLGLIIMGIGTGGFKSNIAPLIAEQITDRRMKVKTLPSGERVIQDAAVTVSRVFLYFYMMINIGSITGQVSMVFAEKYVGFWLAFMLPTCVFILCPMVLFACSKRYVKAPATGSVLGKAMKLWGLAIKTKYAKTTPAAVAPSNTSSFWNNVKPSTLGASRPAWMTFDDQWVDQVARGFDACKIFLWYPLYWLAYNQITNNLTSQSAVLLLNGVPNDLINNLNPLSLIIFIPLFDKFLYPALRKAHIKFTPIKRITLGFFLACAAMIAAAVLQYYIYQMNPCGFNASACDDPTPINVWVQTVPYVLIGFSEIMASVTGLEYAFTKAPENMRSLVQGVYLLQTAFSAALGQALTPLSEDPLLIWNYTTAAILAFLGGCGFWLCHRGLDKREDELNLLADTKFVGRRASVAHEADSERGETQAKF